MIIRRAGMAMSLIAALSVAACDGGGDAASDLQFAEVRKAMDGGDATFETYFADIKGKKIKWSGRVVQSVRQFGDDYIEEGILFVDMDTEGQGSDAADVRMEIKPSQIDSFKPDQPVTFEAIVREYVQGPDGLLLKLELKEIQ